MLKLPRELKTKAALANWLAGLTPAERARWRARVAREKENEALPIIPPPPEDEFISELQIESKELGGLVDFDLWDFQKDLLAAIAANDEALVWTFVLKARQLGISWLIEAHLLYLATFWGNRLLLIFSQSGDDAIAALERVRIMHDSMPSKWRRAKVKDNTEEIAFDNGSRIKAMMATKRAGRGQAPYAVLCDELEFWQWVKEQMATIEAMAPRIYAVTTGNGPDGRAPIMWRNAQKSEGRYRGVFYPWSAHPDRDEEWYVANVVQATEPRLAHREFAASPEEAFAAPEGVYFERFTVAGNASRKIYAQHNWPTWRAVDFGFHWPACLWLQFTPHGQVVVVAELARREPFNWTTAEFAAKIAEIDASLGLFEPPRGTFCDPAGKQVQAQTGATEFEVFRLQGLAPRGEPSSIRDGSVRIMNAISDPDLPLQVSKTCPWLIEALSSIAPDRHRPDLYDEKSSYTHVLDALRYFYVNQATGQQQWLGVDYGSLPQPNMAF